ncbi:MAG TPA: S1/P1 nuclease [Verrucomicrobiae bacterium]|jgi:hypothetical protein|nr:S1/P1 nuclease [Verrucomicrobiae bacterium]
MSYAYLVKNIFVILLILLGLSLSPLPAFAWGSAGHMMIAAEAYRNLSPELKAQVFEVLKSHPDFAKWTNAYHPNANVELAAYVFMRSSTWPDEIRRDGSKYDHPDWHFMDYPLRPPLFPLEPDAKTNDDVLYGIAYCEAIVSNPNADKESRAAYLSYLIHLIGDLHQPLHCASFFGEAYPEGDRGGNDFYVKPSIKGVRLHGIWDSLLGSAMSSQIQWKYAITIATEFPRSGLPELAAHTTPKSWSLESRELAIEKGYLRGKLKGSTNAETAPSLPEGYTAAAKIVAERQAALAGYRLADEIQKYLKLDHPVPLLPANTVPASLAHVGKIGTAEASHYYDETMVVTGKVVDVSIRANVALLNLDKPYPDSPFTVAIFAESMDQFGDLNRFKNHDVELSGTITEYHGKPEMILDSPSEIKITDGK